MNTMTSQQDQIVELQDQLTRLKQQREILLAEINIERESGLDENELKNSIAQAELDLQKTNKKLDKAKALVKQRKLEIKQWKDNFASLDKLDASQELIQLQNEIDWRAKDIAEKEVQIASLYDCKNNQTGVLENLKIKLTILEQGFHQQDIYQDPRLQGLEEELKELNAAIASATAQ